jgi:peptidoglycan/xylan/chitin deacetylase (PgdA/CDA1 family)
MKSILTTAFVMAALFLFSSNTSVSLKKNNSIADTVYTIYLSFDDGPLEGSEDINDAVKKEDIPINVFVVGLHALSSKRMEGFYKLYEDNAYIEIGNHSFTHAHDHYQLYYEKPDSVLHDFIKNQDELQIKNKFARLPGRNMWRLKDLAINDVNTGKTSADSLYKNGYKVFGWDIEWQHSGETGAPIQSVGEMMEIIEKKFKEGKPIKKNHLVLLSHDEMFRNGWEESELKQLILKLKAKGNYRFDHLSNYPD